MPISYPTSGYSFTPQFAQTGALQGLQPLDVTRGARFDVKPLAAIEIQSARPELVAQGIAKGIEAAVGGITSGITAKWKEEKEAEKETRKYKRDLILAGIRAGKDNEDILKRQKDLIDYRAEVEDRRKKSLPEKFSNFPVYGEGDSTDSTDSSSSTDDIDFAGNLPDVADVTEKAESGLFSSIIPPKELNAEINKQRESDARLASAVSKIQNLPLSELSVSTEGAVPAKIEKPSSEFTLTNIPSSLISPEQQAEAISTRKELRKTLAEIEPAKAAKERPQQPGWYPIEKAQEEAAREIKGWKPAEIDETNVRNIGGVPYYLVKPRKAMTGKEIAEQKKGEEGGVNFDTEKKLREEYIGQTKDFKTIQSAWRSIKTSGTPLPGKEPTGASDMALIFGFMKLLDPGSTVREGEYATAQNSGNIPERIVGIYNALVTGKGRLDEKVRADFLDESKKQYESRLGEYEGLKKTYTDLSKEYNLDPKRVVVKFDIPEETTPEKVQKTDIDSLAMELEQFPQDQRNSPEFLAKRKALYDLIKQEQLVKKGQQQPKQPQIPVSQPVFQPAIPRQPKQYGETLESFIGNK